MEGNWNENDAPEKSQKISSICLGYGASDKIGEVKSKEYEEDLAVMAEEHRAGVAAGECYVRVRKRHSRNKDLRVLSRMAQGAKFHK